MNKLGQRQLIETYLTARERIPLLRQAKLFAIDASIYVAGQNETNAFLNSFDHLDSVPDGTLGFEKTEKFKAMQSAANKLPFPDKLPFPLVAFFTEGIELHGEEARGHLLSLRLPYTEESTIILLGQLVDENQRKIWEIFIQIKGNNYQNITLGLHQIPIYDEAEGGWTYPELFTPWILISLCSQINSNKTTLIKGGADAHNEFVSMQNKMHAKRLLIKKAPPPQFYYVPIKNDLMIEELRNQYEYSRSLVQEYSHRWDVRGHERCRIYRGKLPLDHAEHGKFVERDYLVFRDFVDEPTKQRLLDRKMPLLQPGEWLAIKTTWIDHHIKGPEGAPYVPSMHGLREKK